MVNTDKFKIGDRFKMTEDKRSEEDLRALQKQLLALSSMSTDWFWRQDAEFRFIEFSGVSSRNFIPPADSLGKTRWELNIKLTPAQWATHRAILDAHLPFRSFEYAISNANSEERWYSINGEPVFDDDNQFTGYHGTGRDITERKTTEQALIASERRLSAVLDGVQSGVITITEQGIVKSINTSAEQMFGYCAAEVIGSNISMLMPQPYRAEHDRYLGDYLRSGIRKVIGRRRDVMGMRKDGSVFPIELGVYETQLNNKRLFIGSVADLSFRRQAEAELRIAATAFESQAGMVVTDADGVILRVNRAFTETTGYTAEEAVGQTPRILKSGRHDALFYESMWETINSTGGWQGEIWDRRKNGEIYPKWLTVSEVKDENGTITNYIGTHLDITERKIREDQVHQLAFYDTLTNLSNRRLLIDRLSLATMASKRNGRYGALIFLDLDNFKSLNDTQGHGVGDLLLIEAANRLKSCVREMDTVARFGGDEFAVILSALDADKVESTLQARTVAEKIRTALSKPYLMKVKNKEMVDMTVEHHCTASIGVVLFVNNEVSQDDLLKWADTAMYQAKAAGRNLIRFHD